MRKISSLLVLLLFSIAACSSTDNKSQLHGKISQHKDTWIYLEQLQGANIVKIDSVKTNDKGEFSFKKAVPEKDFYRLRVGESNVVFVVLDPKESVQYINETPSLQQKYTLDGSEEGNLILEIKAVKESIAQVWTLLGFFIAWLTLTGTAQQVVGMATLIATAIWLITIPLREDKEE